MQLGDKLAEYIKNFSSYRTTMDFGDVAEILIIAVLLYYALVWMKTTRAWVLLKGLVVILIFAVGLFFRMTTILWMAQNVLGFAVTALIVVLQPELRKALEELGKKNIISSVLPLTTIIVWTRDFPRRPLMRSPKPVWRWARSRPVP